MLKDYLKLAVENLSKRRMRSWLTMIGIFIGVMMLVAIVSLGQGLEKSIGDEFAKLGADKLFIQPKSGFGAPGSAISTITLTDDDVKAVKTANGVVDAVGFKMGQGKFDFKEQSKYPYIMGWPIGNELFNEFMDQYDIEQGRALKSGDNDKVLLGHSYMDPEKFDPYLELRDTIELNGKEFTVVGFLEPIGNSADDMNIYITEKAVDDLFEFDGEVAQIMAKAAKGFDPSDVAHNIERKLRKFRNVDEGKEDFEVQTGEDMLDSFNSILSVVQVFLFAIAGISLAVGGVGITNTMYTAVLERTREIGIMKAIGARNSTILLLFVIESGTLGLVGGGIGILLGMGISKIAEIIIHSTGNTIINAYFPWYLIVGALGFSYVVGTVSGIMPAIQASKQKPVDSLRYE